MLAPKTDKLLNTILLENLQGGHMLRGLLNRVPGLEKVAQRIPDPTVAPETYAAEVVEAVSREGGLPLLVHALALNFPHEQARLNEIRSALGVADVPFVEPSHDLLMDNMAHQFIGELFAHGASDRVTHDVIVGDEIALV